VRSLPKEWGEDRRSVELIAPMFVLSFSSLFSNGGAEQILHDRLPDFIRRFKTILGYRPMERELAPQSLGSLPFCACDLGSLFSTRADDALVIVGHGAASKFRNYVEGLIYRVCLV